MIDFTYFQQIADETYEKFTLHCQSPEELSKTI